MTNFVIKKDERIMYNLNALVERLVKSRIPIISLIIRLISFGFFPGILKLNYKYKQILEKNEY
jgi:hypothetical protein